jgi:hypothetical protein
MPRGKKSDETLSPEAAQRAIGLYDDALEAAKSKDISGLSWALLKTSLEELNRGETPVLGKTIVSELVKNLSANVRKLREVEREDEEKKIGGDDIKKYLLQNG